MAATALTGVLGELHRALELGRGRVPGDVLEHLDAMLERADDRRSLSSEHTVVGLFGPTGSGKSSLSNALSGTAAARVAARRPTTSEPLALVWNRQGSEELLDWLGVGRRVELPAGAPLVGGPGSIGRSAPAPGSSAPQAAADRSEDPAEVTGRQGRAKGLRGLVRQIGRGRPSPSDTDAGAAPPREAAAPGAGLILLDLPDFDSITQQHREVVLRLAGQVDVLIWVVDPQKYADAALHHGFLRNLATHQAVTLVALNQADRLEQDDLAAVLSSLRGILADEGLEGVRVIPVSAQTGRGVDELASAVRDFAQGRAAAGLRLRADAARAAAQLVPFVAHTRVPGPTDQARAVLSEELAGAAGVPLVVDAVRSSYRRDARSATGWPVTRWLGGFRPDPLRRLNLRRQEVAPEVSRSSIVRAQPAQRAAVDHALRVFGAAAAGDVVEPWQTSIRDAARDTAGQLPDSLDTAVTGTDLETGGRPWWWVILGVLQWIAFAALVAGAGWLGVLAVLGFLQLPAIDMPRVEGFPLPTLLIIGGVVAGLLFAGVAAVLARWGARRRAARVRRRLLLACTAVADDVVLRPVLDEVQRCNEFGDAVLTVTGER
ncbi:ABC transporter [Arthrobacter echini]|uniref:ABC transporter n=2 Tax=Arthrobacter echini TaxID=1529066 RepID=A0A4S5E4D5_9MICC|nr:ABC transporter [Arthrobacter echini]